MKILLLLLFVIGTSISSNAQNYIYYFEGELDQEGISLIESELSTIVGVSSTKVKIKEGTTNGEVFISLLKRPERSENDTQFSPSDVKKILISHQLNPIEFIESK